MLGALLLTAQVAIIASPLDSAKLPAIVRRVTIDTSAVVNFRAIVSPETVYVGQQATYQVGAFFERSMRNRVRRPEFFAPEMRGMLSYEPPAELPVYPVSAAGHRYDAFIYQRALFPLTSGLLAVTPARLTYALPLTNSFFSRDESFELRSDSAHVVAIEPPSSDRPAVFSGAVGELNIEARLDTSGARVGNPLALTVRVSGVGNVKLFPRPVLNIPWASTVVADERVILEPNPLVVRGTKEFDWVLTPSRAGILELPVIEYWYFNPSIERYEAATSSAVNILIAPGALAQLDTVATSTARPLPLRTMYRGPLGAPPYAHRYFWLLIGLAPVPAALVFLVRRSPAPRRAEPSAHRLRVLARSRARSAVREVRRVYVRSLAERLNVMPADLTAQGTLERIARRAGVSASLAKAADALLVELNAASYSVEGVASAGVARRAYDIYRAIASEARETGLLKGVTQLGICCLLASAGIAWAAQPNVDLAAPFARGVSAYVARRYGESAEEFLWIARAEPRSADAWANFGTASWAGADTAHAVVGWQRALRLEPLALDARQHLDLVDAPVDGSVAPVPALPPAALVLTAAALWIFAWTLGAFSPRQRGFAALALSAGALAVLTGAVGLTLDVHVAGRDVAVLAHGTPVRALPALASEYGATVNTGEIARVIGRSGEWAHITAAGGREGWVETSALLAVAGEWGTKWPFDRWILDSRLVGSVRSF